MEARERGEHAWCLPQALVKGMSRVARMPGVLLKVLLVACLALGLGAGLCACGSEAEGTGEVEAESAASAAADAATASALNVPAADDVTTGTHHEAQEYCLELEIGEMLEATDAADADAAATADATVADSTDGFRILQLTDTHIAAKDNQALQYAYLDLVIRDADADFIIVTGDLFTYADRTTAKRFFDFIDSYGLPWTVTFGNHDEQCYFSIDWMTSCLNDYGSHCLFRDIQGDDVYGSANFAINLTRDGELFDQLIVMDSNRYNYGGYFGYDWIKQDQIEWYKRLVADTAARNGGEVLPSLLFYHIPVPEALDAWEAALAGDPEATLIFGEANEGVSSPEYNSGFFDAVLQCGSSRAMFFGHDHINDWIVEYKGVIFAYGITSTDRIYSEPDMIGGRVIVLHGDHSLTFENLFHSYDEVM